MPRDPSSQSARRPLSRRDALSVFAGASAWLAACQTSGTEPLSEADGGLDAGPDAGLDGGGDAGVPLDGGGDAGPEAGALPDAGPDAGTACEVTPEGEIGPYFADDSAAGFNRSNVVANLDGSEAQSGVPLALTVTVLDTENSCRPYSGAQIDLWQCNAAGVYSDESSENTGSQNWLRGYQLTGANGTVTFQTIVPGWYSGRTTHIHLRIRSSYSDASSTSDGTNTTQLFFEQTLVDGLAESVAPYNAEGQNPTTNASDRVYSSETGGANLLALQGDNASGYTASITIGLPIRTEYDGGAPGGGGPP